MSDKFYRDMYERGFRRSPNKVKCGKVTYQEGWVCMKQWGQGYTECRVVLCEKPAKKFRQVPHVGMALGIHWVSAGLQMPHNLYAFGDDTHALTRELRIEIDQLNAVDQIAVREILGVTFPKLVNFMRLTEESEN